MLKQLRLSDLSEETVKSLTDKAVIVNEAGQVVGMFVPPPANSLDPDDPFLTEEELERRLREPARPWAEVRERLRKL